VDALHQVEAQTRAPHECDQLVLDVTDAAITHRIDPSSPLVKIGRFDAISDIGKGGFGIVFKAHDPDLDRLVALKLCLTRSPSAIDELMDEAKVLAKLAHPNIVTIYEPGRHDGRVFFAMQYIDGENAERFGERGPSWQEVVDVYRGVARGLAAAHDAGIVHGDVKPKNILLDGDGFPRIADFGLARIVLDDTAESEQEGLRRRAGTLYYMAPEGLRGQPCDALADQWSFGVSLCQTLNGALPFCGRNTAEMLDEIERGDVQFADEFVPVELRAVLRIGLSLEPSERFPDMHALLDELDRLRQTPPPSSLASGSEPDENEPESPPDESGSESKATPDQPELTPLPVGAASPKNKARRGSFAVAVLVGMVCMTLGWVGRGRVEAPRMSEVPRVSEPIPRQEPSPCAVDESDSTMSDDSVLIVTCSRIRAGKLHEATRLWDTEFLDRGFPDMGATTPTDEELVLLRAETLIVARTFVDQAERFHRWAWIMPSIERVAVMFGQPIPDDPATVARQYANRWVKEVEGLEPDDPGLQPIRERIDQLRGSFR
jgi:serine/threonine protein kinase